MQPISKLKIEIVCGNIESVIAAQQGGADRVELCDNLSEGGTTPSYGMIETARRLLSIHLHVIIRPRGGDFLYSDDEYEIMKRDVEICKQLNVDGVVFGILKTDGTIDKRRLKNLVALADPMSVTFHRAFDVTADAFNALEDIIECRCDRILTSGQQTTAMEGADLISQLIKMAADRIIIMPGGGVRPENLVSLIAKTHAAEIHSSAKKIGTGKMEFKREAVKMGDPGFSEYNNWITDIDTVKRLMETAAFY
jgi:copper homeostasis protein